MAPRLCLVYKRDMKPKQLTPYSDDYAKVEKAILFLESHFRSHPTLDEIAASVNLSKFHFQRLFKRWAGITPIQFMQFLTLDYAKEKLARSRSILDAAFDSGLSGTGRLHDLFVTFEAMTPGDYKKMGKGVTIEFGVHPSPFGFCIIGMTQKGICHLGFADTKSASNARNVLKLRWPCSSLNENPEITGPVVKQIFNRKNDPIARPFHLLLKGTNFQVNVWKALLKIPRGHLVCYQDIADCSGRPDALRATATAIGANPVGYLIPCHRVISKSGNVHNYRWGTARKKALLISEAA